MVDSVTSDGPSLRMYRDPSLSAETTCQPFLDSGRFSVLSFEHSSRRGSTWNPTDVRTDYGINVGTLSLTGSPVLIRLGSKD